MFKLCLFALFLIQVGSQKCGRPLDSNVAIANDRIMGGYDVGYYKYPWYAALIRNQDVHCGGSLIGPRTVLTAAHCFSRYMNKNLGVLLEDVYTVRLGMYNICTSESTVTEFRVAKVQLHELYKPNQQYSDISLVTLQNSADQYEPLCLPTGVISRRPEAGFALGMGTLRYGGVIPCTLQEARLLIYPDSTCDQLLKNSRMDSDAKNRKGAFCAGYLTGGIDTCEGDSGGPFQILSESGQYALLGLVTFAIDYVCGVPGLLGMYTDVSQYIEWIKEKGEPDIQFISSFTNHSAEEKSASGDKIRKLVHYSNTPEKAIFSRNSKHKQSSERHKKNKGT